MKKILITGIAGFLGQNLCRALLTKGYTVYGVDDLSIGCREWLPTNVEFNKLDVALERYYEKTMLLGMDGITFTKLEVDCIIHLASRKIPRYGGSDKVLIENTRALQNVIDHAIMTNAQLIYLSTSDVYGKQSDFTESSDSIIGNPTIARWSYAISKMWGEQLLYGKHSVTPNDFTFNIIRLFNTYGPYYAINDWRAGPMSVFISSALKKEPITIHDAGTQQRCFQYVDDAVDGIIRVMESNHSQEIFNIGNPDEAISINGLGRLIWDMINPDYPYQEKTVSPSPHKYEEVQSRIPNITKAQKQLGFYPKVSLCTGLRKTIDWQTGIAG